MEQTYDNHGDCIKCDRAQTYLRWSELGVHFGEPPYAGVLHAVCKNCGYEWAVTAKDET